MIPGIDIAFSANNIRSKVRVVLLSGSVYVWFYIVPANLSPYIAQVSVTLQLLYNRAQKKMKFPISHIKQKHAGSVLFYVKKLQTLCVNIYEYVLMSHVHI